MLDATPLHTPLAATAQSKPRSGANAMARLKKRRDFLAAAKARKSVQSSVILQARRRRDGEAGGGVRVGFTASKKVGGAVIRNRAKRRLRAAAEAVVAARGRDGWDYVLIARADTTASGPFQQLLTDLARAIEKAHAPKAKQKSARNAADAGAARVDGDAQDPARP